MGCTPVLGKAKIKKPTIIETGDNTSPKAIILTRKGSGIKDTKIQFSELANRKISLFSVKEEPSALEHSANPSFNISPAPTNQIAKFADFSQESAVKL
ncbi:unnamed protein product [Blepharisma stoltei]|uniref:Uncharacterized protein n=1 Tax=Blepharisma stoltei TaxID=1481888 RepID=A0AAU9IQX4_9CILI|nr:unnamed protein product [Blepharisma stoltei]